MKTDRGKNRVVPELSGKGNRSTFPQLQGKKMKKKEKDENIMMLKKRKQ